MFDRIHDKIMDNTKLKRFKKRYMKERDTQILNYVQLIRRKQWYIPTPPIIKAMYPAVARGVQELVLPILLLPPVPAPQPVQANDRQREGETPKIRKATKQKIPNDKDEWINTSEDHKYLFGSSQKGQSYLQKLERILVQHHLWENVNGRKT